jgi:dolichol-phosphate mannosyltransferase
VDRNERKDQVEALVIIPTYNERDNIEVLIQKTLSIDNGLEVLVVDDNSPDGTGTFVEEWGRKEKRVHVLHRPEKMGLGSAYIAGFNWALRETDAKYVFEMDADYSHDPDALPEFLETIEDVDLVLGSRYLNGITVMNWPLSRLILSVSANIYTRIITGMPIKDATGGYKCFRREVLESLPLEKIKSDGYSFQIEVNYLAWKRGFRIREIPIVFVDRRVGISKMSRRIIWEAAFLVWKLRFDSILKSLKQN